MWVRLHLFGGDCLKRCTTIARYTQPFDIKSLNEVAPHGEWISRWCLWDLLSMKYLFDSIWGFTARAFSQRVRISFHCFTTAQKEYSSLQDNIRYHTRISMQGMEYFKMDNTSSHLKPQRHVERQKYRFQNYWMGVSANREIQSGGPSWSVGKLTHCVFDHSHCCPWWISEKKSAAAWRISKQSNEC